MLVFFFKHKTAYEMRISDWSSDVCSSDLDLLAYLVRRLLENGANSSFVHQFSDPDVTAEELAVDPRSVASAPATIPTGLELYGVARRNSRDRKSTRLNSSH